MSNVLFLRETVFIGTPCKELAAMFDAMDSAAVVKRDSEGNVLEYETGPELFEEWTSLCLHLEVDFFNLDAEFHMFNMCVALLVNAERAPELMCYHDLVNSLPGETEAKELMIHAEHDGTLSWTYTDSEADRIVNSNKYSGDPNTARVRGILALELRKSFKLIRGSLK